jgi:hypothetical protein
MSNIDVKYFGTNMDSAGHFFWNVGKEYLTSSDLWFNKLPFDPEQMPDAPRQKGEQKFYNIEDYSILYTCGSAIDKRHGCKSVFFIKQLLSEEQLMEILLSLKPYNQIIQAIKKPQP